MVQPPQFDVPDLSPAQPRDVVRHRCVGCDALSPPAETNFTLISVRYGWRLFRGKRADGTQIYEWRCPACWEAFRGRDRSLRGKQTKRSSG